MSAAEASIPAVYTAKGYFHGVKIPFLRRLCHPSTGDWVIFSLIAKLLYQSLECSTALNECYGDLEGEGLAQGSVFIPRNGRQGPVFTGGANLDAKRPGAGSV